MSENTPLNPSLGKLCDHLQLSSSSNYDKVPPVVKRLLKTWKSKENFSHISPVSIPSQEKIIELIYQVRRILFPGYFTSAKLHASNLEYYLGKKTTDLYEQVAEQITMAIRHDCRRNDKLCTNCEENAHNRALKFIESLPDIAAILNEDVRSTLVGDPAIKSQDEVIFSYPGLFATSIFRVAHVLFELEVPIIPRIMTEHAHSLTGIDIHPGATIGPGLFIDHGTGLVIGETTVIGKNVRLYQGVTLGALSLPRDAGTRLKNRKRHPTIEDDVIIYSNTTILGGDTVIGARSIIGGNIWLTESVAPDTKVLLKKPELKFSSKSS